MSLTTQSDVTSALTEAIQTIANSTANSVPATLTIEADITKIVDEGLGTYTVSYLGSSFDVFSANKTTNYKIGDRVYVLVPNGDFGKDKVILSLAAPSVETYAVSTDGVRYIAISDNLFAEVRDISLCTYKPHSPRNENVTTTGFSALFQAALTDSRTFNFTCKIRTNIEEERRSKGNYGLILDIPVVQNIDGVEEQKYYSVKCDVNNIAGDPYNLSSASLQNFYFTFPEDMTYDDAEGARPPRIRSFVEDFLGEDSSAEDDIFITDIQLLSALSVSEEVISSGVYAVIKATEGNSFLVSRTSSTKTLSVIAYLNGKVTNNSNFSCYWFKENVSINTTSDKYQRFGGLGWEILNEVSSVSIRDDGTKSYDYVTNVYTQEVKQEDLHCDTRFKCVLVQNETIITAETTIKNLEVNASLTLTSITGSPVFSQGVGRVGLQLTYHEDGVTNIENPNFTVGYSWQRYDKKGNYIDNDFFIIEDFNKKVDNNYVTTIYYPTSEVDEANTIACTAYTDIPNDEGTSVKRQTIGTVWLTVSIGESAKARVIVANGDKIYKYDADGDSPMVADYDGPLTSAIKTITPLSVTVFKEDGTELTEDEYSVTTITWLVPINSMITIDSSLKTDTESNKGYYTISGNYSTSSTLAYGISNTYNKNKTDNTIIVRASAPSAVLTSTASNIANIRFIKDGEAGTNGSKYSAILTYNGYGYGEKDGNGKINKLQLIYVARGNQSYPSGWYLYNPANPGNYTAFSSINLTPVLYADGAIVDDIPSTTWALFDAAGNYEADNISSPVVINKSTGAITSSGMVWTDTNINFCATIEAKVAAMRDSTSTSLTNSEEYVYAYYPIECSYINKAEYLMSYSPTMTGGFSQVVYAADGTNPKYDNSEPFEVADLNNGEDSNSFYNYTWSASSNLTCSSSDNGPTRNVIPTSKYDNGVAKNFVKVTIEQNSTQAAAIINRWNVLSGELTNQRNILEYYEMLQNNLDFFANFDYNSYIEDLTSAAPFYLLKTKLIDTTNQMLSEANKLLELCNVYLYNSSSTVDSDVQAVITETTAKVNLLNQLAIYCTQLGIDSHAIENIKTIAPSTVVIDNKISSTSRTCYYTINNAIDIYNNVVNNDYNTYYNELDDESISAYATTILSVMAELESFTESEKLQNLASSYERINIEIYRYSALKIVLKAKVAEAIDAYSYNDVIQKIIEPMYQSISWYISFYEAGGYTDEINSAQEEIDSLNEQITQLKNMETAGTSTYVIHVKPIIMIYNRYEMSNINGWDGNKLVVDSDGGYIIAPQVGAGVKNTDNTFTGIVMGVKQLTEHNDPTNQKIGLFGYSSGAQSIFLDAEDGSAIFGNSGAGQITIDPSRDSGLIYSGNYFDSDTDYDSKGKLTESAYNNRGKVPTGKNRNGTLFDVSGGYIHFGNANYGKIYSGSHSLLSSAEAGFYLSHDGLSIGSKVYIDSGGVLKLGTGATTGATTNWTINGDTNKSYITYAKTTYNDTKDGVYIGTDGIGLGKGVFYVTNSGALTAKNATITGTINSTSGKIGGFTINDSSISASGVTISTSGISLGSTFSVTNAGVLNATSGTIGGFTITNNKLYSGEGESNAGIGGSGTYAFWAGSETPSSAPFRVGHSGILTASNATITGTIYASSGEIGGFKIGSSSISNTMTSLTDTSHDGVWIGTNGIALGKGKFKVTDAGVLTATSGTIGGITITSSKIYSGTDNNIAGMGGSSTYAFWAGDETPGSAPFRVGHSGTLVATSATIEGKITATSGEIGGCAISNGKLTIPSANISGTLTADKIQGGTLDSNLISADSFDGKTMKVGAGSQYRIQLGITNVNGTECLIVGYASGGSVPVWGLTAASGTRVTF